MRKTYVMNAFIFGPGIGVLVGASTKSVALGIIVGIIATVIIFAIIKAIENGLDKAGDAIQNAYYKKKNESQNAHSTSQSLAEMHGTSGGSWRCPNCGATNDGNASQCKSCGKARHNQWG